MIIQIYDDFSFLYKIKVKASSSSQPPVKLFGYKKMCSKT